MGPVDVSSLTGTQHLRGCSRMLWVETLPPLCSPVSYIMIVIQTLLPVISIFSVVVPNHLEKMYYHFVLIKLFPSYYQATVEVVLNVIGLNAFTGEAKME